MDSLEISPLTLELFTSTYDWPGNVRELRNAIARVVCLGAAPDTFARDEVASANPPDSRVDIDEPYLQAKKRIVDAFERDYVLAQLRRSGNNIAQAARSAGMDRSYFKRVLKRHRLLERARRSTGGDD